MKKKPETCILSIRLLKTDRDRIVAEAERAGVSISEYALGLIWRAIEGSKKAGVPGIQPAAEQPEVSRRSGETMKPHKEEKKPKVQPKVPATQDDDEFFLNDLKKRFPGIDHDRLLRRLDEALTGKPRTRRTVERLFKIASEKVVNK